MRSGSNGPSGSTIPATATTATWMPQGRSCLCNPRPRLRSAALPAASVAHSGYGSRASPPPVNRIVPRPAAFMDGITRGLGQRRAECVLVAGVGRKGPCSRRRPSAVEERSVGAADVGGEAVAETLGVAVLEEGAQFLVLVEDRRAPARHPLERRRGHAHLPVVQSGVEV